MPPLGGARGKAIVAEAASQQAAEADSTQLALVDPDEAPASEGANDFQGSLDAEEPEWVEHHDEGTGTAYYYNTQTKETTWTKPEAALDATKDASSPQVDAGNPEVEAGNPQENFIPEIAGLDGQFGEEANPVEAVQERTGGTASFMELRSTDLHDLIEKEGGNGKAREKFEHMLGPATRYVHEKTLVPREALIGVVKETIKQRRDCLQIPIVIIYYILWGLLLIRHERIVDLSQVEREFRGMMEETKFLGLNVIGYPDAHVSGHKRMDDIHTKEDVYLYLIDSMLPLFIANHDSVVSKEYNRVLIYNQLIGGVRISQTRRAKAACSKLYPKLGPLDENKKNPLLKGVTCYPLDTVDEACFGPWKEMSGFCPGITYSSEMDDSRRLRNISSKPLAQAPKSLGKSVPYRRSREGFRKGKGGIGRRLGGGGGLGGLGGGGGGVASTAAAGGAFGRRLITSTHAVRKAMKKSLRATQESKNMFTAIMHEHDGLEVAKTRVREMQDKNWIDDQTSWVGIRLFALNPDLGVYVSATTNVYFAPSGEVVPHNEVNTFLAEPYMAPYGAGLIVLDVLFCLSLLHLVLDCIVDLVGACKKGREGLTMYWSQLFVILDWLTAVGGIVMLILWVVYVAKLSVVRETAMRVVQDRPTPSASDAMTKTYMESMMDMEKANDDFVPFLTSVRNTYSLYTLLIMLRFLKAFEAQPKLAVVTQTLARCFVDLVHFLIVLLVQLVAFVAASMSLYGHRLVQFSDFSSAFLVCAQIVVGNFDYDELADEYPWTTAAWFICFIFLMTLIMFNMLLAIIMDVYGAAKHAASFSDTIWEQVRKMLHDFVNQRVVVSLKEVLKVLEAHGEEDMSEDTLMEACPGMQHKQANALIEKVDELEIAGDEDNLGWSDATRLVVSIKKDTDNMGQLIHELRGVSINSRAYVAEQQKMAQKMGSSYDPRAPRVMRLTKTSERRVTSLEGRLDKLEGFMNEAMSYMVFRGKEATTRLKSMETILRKQRDTVCREEEQ